MGQALKGAPPDDFPKPAPLSSDIGAGPRRALEDLRPEVVEDLNHLAPPVNFLPEIPTTVPPPTTQPPSLLPFLTTTTVPRPTTTLGTAIIPATAP
jgi:hypothetical protein